VLNYKLNVDSSVEIVMYTIAGSTAVILLIAAVCLGARCYIVRRQRGGVDGAVEEGAPLNAVEAGQVELSRRNRRNGEVPGTAYTFDSALAAALAASVPGVVSTEDEMMCSICLCEFEVRSSFLFFLLSFFSLLTLSC
jgi:hypothetical protein